MKSLPALAVLFSGVAHMAMAGEDIAGYDKFTVKADHRPELLSASVWYPADTATYRVPIGDNPIFNGTDGYVGAAPKNGHYPLVVLSHGSGGNMDGLSWLSSELAKHGIMVLAVNHPGTTSGDSSPRRTVRLAERAYDLSAALDTMLADPTWGNMVDRGKIVSFGFSLGGATALGLAGARFDRAAYKDYCDRIGEGGVDCVFLAEGGVDLSNLPDLFAADMRDMRISEAIAVDPGFTYAITDTSLRAINMPVLLINLGKNNRFIAGSVDESGSNLVARLPEATYDVFAPAHHFTFLATCKPGAKKLLIEEGEDPICDDPERTDRAGVHKQVVESVIGFLRPASAGSL